MVRLIKENDRKAWNNSFDLNIWWNLNMLRDTLKGVRPIIYLTLLSFYPEFIEYRLKQSTSIKILDAFLEEEVTNKFSESVWTLIFT